MIKILTEVLISFYFHGDQNPKSNHIKNNETNKTKHVIFRRIVMKRVKDVINFHPTEERLKLNSTTIIQKEKVIEDFIAEEEFAMNLITLLKRLENTNGCGIWITGSRGAGKTHMLSFLASVAANRESALSIRNQNLFQAAAKVAGRYEIILVDLEEASSFRESVFNAIAQRFLEKNIGFKGFVEVLDDRQNLQMANEWLKNSFVGKGIMLVIDGMTEFLSFQTKEKVKKELRFLRDLSMLVKHAGLTVVLGIDSIVMHENRFLPLLQHLTSKTSCYIRMDITEAQVREVIYQRCLIKTDEQKEQIWQYLLPFLRLYPHMEKHFEEYVDFFPLHPSWFNQNKDILYVGKQRIIETFSKMISAHLENQLSEAPAIITFDYAWKMLKASFSGSANIEIKRLFNRRKEIIKAINLTYDERNKCQVLKRLTNALLLKQIASLDTDKVGMTLEEIRDNLLIWPDAKDANNAEKICQYIDNLLSDLIEIIGRPALIEKDVESQQYYIVRKKKDSYNKKVTLDEISQKINISRTTLYKIINNKGYVSEKTREVVEQALKEYNYVPNFNARDLAHHKSYRIGYIGMSHYGSTFFSKLVQNGIKRALGELSDNGLEVVSAISHITQPQQQIIDIENMLQQGIRDFVIVPCNPEVLRDEIKKMRKMECNIIFLSRYVDEPLRTFVGIDYPKSGRLAAEMLCKIMPYGGNIAITTSNKLEDDFWVKQRYQGFLDYLSGKSEFHILCLEEGIRDSESAEQICEKIIEKHPNVDAIYDISYKSDVIARQLVKMNRDHSIKLIGFDLYDAVIPYVKSSVIDVIIGQSLSNQAYDAIKMMFYHVCYGTPIINEDYYSRLDVIVASNVDCFDY